MRLVKVSLSVVAASIKSFELNVGVFIGKLTFGIPELYS